MDWKETIKAVAPSIATALGGPLAGTAVRVLGEAVLGDKNASEQAVAEAVTAGLHPSELVKLREADNLFKVQMRQLELDETKAYIGDTQDARRAHSTNERVFWLGVAIMIVFCLVCGAAVTGSYYLLVAVPNPNVTLVATVFGFIGTTVGYAANQAQQVVGFYFGSSRGSDEKNKALADAAKALGGIK